MITLIFLYGKHYILFKYYGSFNFLIIVLKHDLTEDHGFESLSCNLNIYSSFIYLKPIKDFLQKQLKVIKIKLVYLDSFSHLEQKNNHFCEQIYKGVFVSYFLKLFLTGVLKTLRTPFWSYLKTLLVF